MTQRDKIKAAKRAYIMPVGPSWSRFTIYVDAGNGLDVLWPEDSHLGRKFKDKLNYQRYSERKGAPAYSFVLSGTGYSKVYGLTQMLLEVNPDLDVSKLDPGWSPGTPS